MAETDLSVPKTLQLDICGIPTVTCNGVGCSASYIPKVTNIETCPGTGKLWARGLKEPVEAWAWTTIKVTKGTGGQVKVLNFCSTCPAYYNGQSQSKEA